MLLGLFANHQDFQQPFGKTGAVGTMTTRTAFPRRDEGLEELPKGCDRTYTSNSVLKDIRWLPVRCMSYCMVNLRG